MLDLTDVNQAINNRRVPFFHQIRANIFFSNYGGGFGGGSNTAARNNPGEKLLLE
jgi:hypothetical protein